jgi:hypothetical protein
MALPIVGSDQRPILKYNAKSAKWKVDDLLLNEISMLVDMPAVEVGWMRLSEGQAPDFRMMAASELAAGTPFPALPDERGSDGKPAYRKGFRVAIKLSDQIAAGRPSVREWSSCSLATCRGLDRLHDQWLEAERRHPNHVPLVRSNGAEVMSSRAGGDNYSPTLTIERWVPRPSDFKSNSLPVAIAGGSNFDDLDDPIDDIPFNK